MPSLRRGSAAERLRYSQVRAVERLATDVKTERVIPTLALDCGWYAVVRYSSKPTIFPISEKRVDLNYIRWAVLITARSSKRGNVLQRYCLSWYYQATQAIA